MLQRRWFIRLGSIWGAALTVAGLYASSADALALSHPLHACIRSDGLIKVAASCPSGEEAVALEIDQVPGSNVKRGSLPASALEPSSIGRGLSLGGGILSLNEAVFDPFQKRVTGTPCPAGEAISSIQASGAASCVSVGTGTAGVDSITAGSGLTEDQSTGNVTISATAPFSLSGTTGSSLDGVISGDAQATGSGVVGSTNDRGGNGVFGQTDGDGAGVAGVNMSTGAAGAFNSSRGVGVDAVGFDGLHGTSTGAAGNGVLGKARGDGAGVAGVNTSTGAAGAFNSSRGDGVDAVGGGPFAVHGTSSGGIGVGGVTSANGWYGVEGVDTSPNGGYGGAFDSPHGVGVAGTTRGTGPASYGVLGLDDSSSGGVAGRFTSFHNTGIIAQGGQTGIVASGGRLDPGVSGTGGSDGGYGIVGQGERTGGGGYFKGGVTAGVGLVAIGGRGGYTNDESGAGIDAFGGGYGLYGSPDLFSGPAIYGHGYGSLEPRVCPCGYAGYFEGDVYVDGTLAAKNKDFRIDDPLDAAHKYLIHTSVESPDAENIYNGNVTSDRNGYATVTLPDYFDAENTDPRYVLTVIGSFAQAVVWKKERGNQFVIRTNQPSVEVTWMVIGIRNDPYARSIRGPVEQPKLGADVGRYLSPEVYGKPASLGIGWAPRPRIPAVPTGGVPELGLLPTPPTGLTGLRLPSR